MSYVFWNNLPVNSLICMFLINTCYIYVYYFTIWNFRKFFFFKQVFKFFSLLLHKNIFFSIIINFINFLHYLVSMFITILLNLTILNVYIYVSYVFYRSTGVFFFIKEILFYISFNFLNNNRTTLKYTFVLFNKSEYILNLESYKSTIYDFQIID